MSHICPGCGLHFTSDMEPPRSAAHVAWTARDVEAETLAGYHVPAISVPMADWQIARLNAWNKAIALGGKHYEEWRAVFIAPIEAGWRNGAIRSPAHLDRHQISKLLEYERRWITQSPASDPSH